MKHIKFDKLLSLVLSALLLIAGLPFSSAADENVEKAQFDYEIVDGMAVITGYTLDSNSDGSLVIPDKLGGTPVGKISGTAFAGKSDVKSLTIPANVTQIEAGAFRKSGLVSITIADGVTEIAPYTFAECESLTDITLSDDVKSIGEFAFMGCTGLVGLYLPVSVTKVEKGLFLNCSSLESVSLSDNVCDIAERAFAGCTNLKFVFKISDNLKSIGSQAFSGCASMEKFYIPDSVEVIEGNTFEGCTSLRTVKISNSVEIVGTGLFADCADQLYVKISGTVIDRFKTIFSACLNKVQMVETVGNVTEIGEAAFSQCTGLGCVVIPEGVKSIGAYAFQGCTGLGGLFIPQSVETMGENIFLDCPDIRVSGYNDTKAQEYANDHGIPFELSSLVENGFRYAPYKDGAVILSYHGSYEDVNVDLVVPSHLGGIPVKAIEDYAFVGEDSINSVLISEGITEIRTLAFANSCVAKIVIPASMTSIDYDAFDRCNQLTEFVVAEGNPLYSSRDGVLFSKDGTQLIQYPLGRKDITYTVPEGTTGIGRGAFKGCVELTSVNLPDSLIRIGDYAFQSCSALTSIVIPDSVTDMGHVTFACCPALVSVRLPNGIEMIGQSTFASCTSLKSIEIPDSVTLITIYAFSHCISLTEVILPNQTAVLDGSVFSGCENLTKITVPQSVESIGELAFDGCSRLVINGYFASAAEQYAMVERIPFRFLDETLPERGDINGDEAIDAGDALKVLQYVVNLSTLDTLATADVNQSGLADITDALLILQKTVGLIEQFPTTV